MTAGTVSFGVRGPDALQLAKEAPPRIRIRDFTVADALNRLLTALKIED
ncbi:hypothetical protein ACFY4C_21115 [Actinomadura viridis]